MKGSDGKLCFSKKDGSRVWKDYKDGIMNERNGLDLNVEDDTVEGPVEYTCRDNMVQILRSMKIEDCPGLQMCDWN